MNWGAAWEVVCDVGKAVYAAGLLTIGVQMLRVAPGMQRALNALAGASVQLAAALRASIVGDERIAQIATDVTEIKARKGVDPVLLDRVYRALEQREAAQRSQAETS